jgi:hypothetical protein
MTALYDSHPAFGNYGHRDSDTCKAPVHELHFFNDNYQVIQNRQTPLRTVEIREISRSCFNSLDLIFEVIQGQETGQQRSLFLQELHTRCKRLLQDDLMHHGRERRLREPNASSQLSNLFLQKFCTGLLHKHEVCEMQRIAHPLLMEFRTAEASGQNRRENLSRNSGPVIKELIKQVNNSFERCGINALVSAYIGQNMKVNGLALEMGSTTSTWWHNTYIDLTIPPKTLYMHTDESFAYPKAFIYLGDISKSQGAFSVVPGALEKINPSPIQYLIGRIIASVGRKNSSLLHEAYHHVYHQPFGCAAFRSDFMSLPQEMKYSSHFGWDILPGSELEDWLIKAEQWQEGPAGFFTVFDGAQLVHRALLMEKGEHLSLQVIFSPTSSLVQKSYKKLLSLSRKAFLPNVS